MTQSARVIGFDPTINGLQFPNQFDSGIPDWTFHILGQTLKLGDAGNGLCGGFVYTVMDCFETGLLPPTDSVAPAGGTPLFNYIVARLTNSFDESDVTKYLSWICMNDGHTIVYGDGISGPEIKEEWPKIKADLDSNQLSPLGLVSGQELPVVGYIPAFGDLKSCHQVVAWGYDLDGTALTIYIYDPDNPGNGNTITLDIAHPGDKTPITVTNWSTNTYRGFFRTNYSYHDPRTPASGAFIQTVVTSPGITCGGPVTLIASQLPDGTLLREKSGTIWVIFGEAKFHVPDPTTLSRLYPNILVHQLPWDGSLINIGNAPVDGTLLREEGGTIWVIFGEAKFHVPDPTTLSRLYPNIPIHQLWNGALDQIGYIPVDGTLFREESSSQVYEICSGQKQIAPSGAPGTVHVLWDGALAQFAFVPSVITGKITDANGAPLPAEDPSITLSSAGNPNIWTGGVTSGVDYYISTLNNIADPYEPTSIPPGVYTVSVSCEGFAPAEATVTVLAGEATVTQNFLLQPIEPVTVTGQVTDINGTPIEATVGTTTTDSTGHYSLKVWPISSGGGVYGSEEDFSATAPGFMPSSYSFPTMFNGGTLTHNFALVKQGILTVTTKDAQGGSPIANASLFLDSKLIGTTDSKGSFSMAVPTPGQHNLYAIVSGFERSDQLTITIAPGTTVTQNFSLVRATPGNVKGIVSLGDGGSLGVTKRVATVTALAPIGPTTGDISTKTDSGGNYTLANVLSGWTTIRAAIVEAIVGKAAPYEPQEQTIKVIGGVTITLNFDLQFVPPQPKPQPGSEPGPHPGPISAS